MKTSELLLHPVDSFRTAPVPLTLAAGWSAMTAVMVDVAQEMHRNDEVLGLATAGVTAALALRGIYLSTRSFRLRGRLENSLETTGFNDRIFTTTTQDWCTRQTALVACEQYDEAASYQDLCDRSKEGAKFTSLPQL